MSSTSLLDRRSFLKTSAAAGAGLWIGFHLPVSNAQENETAAKQEKKPPNPLNAWIHVSPDNHVILIVGKSEMGQGIMTTLPMILAEELSLDWKTVRIQQAPTDPAIYDLGTGGSGSVAGSYLPLRRAGAAAREMFITAAAQHWNVNPDTCVAKDGGILHGRAQEFPYLRRTRRSRSKTPGPRFQNRSAQEFLRISPSWATTSAGMKELRRSMAPRNLASIPRVPGMQYAVIERCPIFGGKLKSFDAAKAKAVPGVIDVFPVDPVGSSAFTAGGVVVVADSSWAAMQGRKALQVSWDEGPARPGILRQPSPAISRQRRATW